MCRFPDTVRWLAARGLVTAREAGGNSGSGEIDGGQGEAASQAVLDLTGGIGADAALECVGTGQSIATAFAAARPGSVVGIAGVPHGQPPFAPAFFRNTGWRGGPAPARIYIPELLGDVLGGTINPGRVFDYETSLDHIAGAYEAMRAVLARVKRRDRAARHVLVPPRLVPRATTAAPSGA